jgi:phosphoribosylamine-glycine ligase
MKKIMILAGGNDQAALMEELRRYFHGDVELILLDMVRNVKAYPYADRFLQISTMDKEAVLKAALSEKIDYILTACGDQPLSTMAYVSAQMGLPCYLSEEKVRDLTNKIYMKKKMVENGIPTANHVYVEEGRKLPDITGLSYPLIVKPVDSNGSKGVRKVMKESELMPLLQEALHYSISKKAIIEEFKEGMELSVDAYVEGATAKLLCVTTSNKIKENKDSFTILQSEYPPRVEFSEECVREIVQQIADVFELKDTPLLVQMIVGNGEYNVVEFSARMGGGSKYHLINVLSGIDIMKVYVEMVMGEKPHVEPVRQWDKALMNYVYCRPGTFAELKNFEELKNDGIIYSYFTYKMPNAVIEKSNTSSDRVAGFLVVGNSSEEIREKFQKANSLLQVLNLDGEDIMRHDFYLQ